MPGKKAKCFSRGLLALLLALVSGCVTSPREYVRNGFKVGPNYRQPPAPVAPQWLDAGLDPVNSSPVDLTGWWKVFNDPVLDGLVQTAYRQNLDLRTAGTRILEARALRNFAAGNLLPQVQNAFGSFNHFQISRNLPGLPPDASGITTNYSLWGTGLNLSWELDFWGRFRRALESANANLDSSVDNYDAVLVLLISEVASAYVQIRTFQARIQFAQSNIDIQSMLAKRAEDRFKQGAASKLDLAQMRSNLRDTQALKQQLEIGLRQTNNALCVLLGIPPRLLMEELGTGPIPQAPPEVVVGIPADLVRRRPDVRRAERQVAAQSARIGVAVSELYPHFYINGSLGYQAEHLSHLFDSKSTTGNIGPGFQWNILNYGRLLSLIQVEDARFQKEVLTYQSTVLRAGREVEDALIAFVKSRIRADYLADSAREAKTAVKVVEDEIKLLKFDINRAFVTANFLVGQQDKLAVARGDIAQSLIQVYKGLGGGWEIRLPNRAAGPRLLPPPAEAGSEPGRPELLPPPQGGFGE